jgi:maleylpyruvate isomerase
MGRISGVTPGGRPTGRARGDWRPLAAVARVKGGIAPAVGCQDAAMTPQPPSPRSPDEVRLDQDRCRAAHRRLLDHVGLLDDEAVRRPSLLPGWTVGHLVTHLARNADSHVGMLEAVLAGEVRAQYPGGPAQRAGDIERGAGRPAAELVDDLRGAVGALEAVWDRLDDDRWTNGRSRTATFDDFPVSVLPMMRWREVEIHRADLGDPAFTWAQWSGDFVVTELPELLRLLGLRASSAPADEVRRWVAVLTGRLDEPVRLPAVLD